MSIEEDSSRLQEPLDFGRSVFFSDGGFSDFKVRLAKLKREERSKTGRNSPTRLPVYLFEHSFQERINSHSAADSSSIPLQSSSGATCRDSNHHRGVEAGGPPSSFLFRVALKACNYSKFSAFALFTWTEFTDCDLNDFFDSIAAFRDYVVQTLKLGVC